MIISLLFIFIFYFAWFPHHPQMSDLLRWNICILGREGEVYWKGLTLSTLVQATPASVFNLSFPTGCFVFFFVMCRGPRWETGLHVQGAIQTH